MYRIRRWFRARREWDVHPWKPAAALFAYAGAVCALPSLVAALCGIRTAWDWFYGTLAAFLAGWLMLRAGDWLAPNPFWSKVWTVLFWAVVLVAFFMGRAA